MREMRIACENCAGLLTSVRFDVVWGLECGSRLVGSLPKVANARGLLPHQIRMWLGVRCGRRIRRTGGNGRGGAL